MIWQSVWAMTIIDLLVLGVVAFSLIIFFRTKRHDVSDESQFGFVLILFGLLVICLFYFADLLVMHALPIFLSMDSAMAVMEDMHLNYRWFVTLFGIGAVSLGFAIANRGVVSLILKLENSEVSLRQELAQRQSAEARLQKQVRELEFAKSAIEEQGKKVALLAEDLALANDQAQAASHAKSQFLANMSHELRTPLNAIIGFSDTIRSEKFGAMDNAKYREYLVDISNAGKDLLQLINEILDLSKVEVAMLELHEETIDIPQAVRFIMKLVQLHAERRGVRLQLEMPDELPALLADEQRLRQILLNLLNNAVKFTNGDGKVTLKVHCNPDSGHVFQIIDTGIGIASRDIPKAMSQFGQVGSVLVRQHDGAGLGLPLAKSLVELHGGSLDLQSEFGVGTVATVRFPVDRIVQAHDVYPSTAADQEAS